MKKNYTMDIHIYTKFMCKVCLFIIDELKEIVGRLRKLNHYIKLFALQLQYSCR